MIKSKLFSQIDSRMKQIFQYKEPFGNKDMILCKGLRQLSPVRQIRIYKRTSLNFTANLSVLKKIGNGGKLTDDECEYLEHRFVNRASIDQINSAAIRFFHTNKEIDEYHASIFNGLKHETHIAHDE